MIPKNGGIVVCAREGGANTYRFVCAQHNPYSLNYHQTLPKPPSERTQRRSSRRERSERAMRRRLCVVRGLKSYHQTRIRERLGRRYQTSHLLKYITLLIYGERSGSGMITFLSLSFKYPTGAF